MCDGPNRRRRERLRACARLKATIALWSASSGTRRRGGCCGLRCSRGRGRRVWDLARSVVRSGASSGWAPPTKRRVRLAVLCARTKARSSPTHLELACQALGIDAELYAAPYGQLEQEVLDPSSGLAGFEPTHVLIAPTASDLDVSVSSPTSGAELLDRRRGPVAAALGLPSARHSAPASSSTRSSSRTRRRSAIWRCGFPASRLSLVRALNARLGARCRLVRPARRLRPSRGADRQGAVVRSAPLVRDAPTLRATPPLPLLARETAAVLAGDVGLGAPAAWWSTSTTRSGAGIVGEEGLGASRRRRAGRRGVRGVPGVLRDLGAAGHAARGRVEERRRGSARAVRAKPEDAAPARRLRRLRRRLAAKAGADWSRSPTTLGLGLDALVFADDNPAECAEVAAASAGRRHGRRSTSRRRSSSAPLAASVRLELPALTEEDVARQKLVRGPGRGRVAADVSASLEDFWRSLEMRGTGARRRRRVAGTGGAAHAEDESVQPHARPPHRRRRAQARSPTRHRSAGHSSSKTDSPQHGIVGLVLAVPATDDPATLTIDTLLLSCRVIGRTAETHLLSHVSRAALEQGCVRVRGVYVPGPRNELVADLYPRLGFTPSPAATGSGTTIWPRMDRCRATTSKDLP